MLAGLGWQELLIVLLIAVLVFGGSRLAGIGKASGRAIREFKEETNDIQLRNKKVDPALGTTSTGSTGSTVATQTVQDANAVVEPQRQADINDIRAAENRVDPA